MIIEFLDMLSYAVSTALMLVGLVLIGSLLAAFFAGYWNR